MIDTKDFITKTKLKEVTKAANLLSEYFSKTNKTEEDLAELRKNIGELIERKE